MYNYVDIVDKKVNLSENYIKYQPLTIHVLLYTIVLWLDKDAGLGIYIQDRQ